MYLIRSIATVGGFTMISRITGFIRDVLIARFLGASLIADAFFVALKLPNLFRSLFAEGAFNSAFVPLFAEQMELNGREKAKMFARETFSALLYIVALFVALMEIIMPYAVMVVAPGFIETPGKVALTAELCRITFPFLLLVSLNSMQGGILNTCGKFAAPAFTSTILNLTMIASLFVLTPYTDGPAFALAWGVTISGVIQFLFLAWHLRKEGMLMRLVAPFKVLFRASEEAVLLLKRILPGVVGSGIYQINLVIDMFFVSFLATGSVSFIYYANRMFQLPVGILGAAIGTALLPLLTRQIKKGNLEGEKESMSRALEVALLSSVPAALGLAILDVPIIAALFEYGAFTSVETEKTAAALSAFAVGLPAYVVSKTLLPAFYSRGDTSSPVRVAAIALILNAFLCYTLMQEYGHVGIALATSITAWINLGQYFFMLKRRGFLHTDKHFKRRVPKILVSALLMAWLLQLALYGTDIYVGDWLHQGAWLKITVLSVLVTVGIIIFSILALITRAFKISDLKLKGGKEDDK
ncbi:MAG: murein biosynthesis integral membrane protein MurJ [Alphaproteobacteria bacterium]|nr:murein biosynthesis integral membrane protein MurJ [Alphaproteobacteria bacterium]